MWLLCVPMWLFYVFVCACATSIRLCVHTRMWLSYLIFLCDSYMCFVSTSMCLCDSCIFLCDLCIICVYLYDTYVCLYLLMQLIYLCVCVCVCACACVCVCVSTNRRVVHVQDIWVWLVLGGLRQVLSHHQAGAEAALQIALLWRHAHGQKSGCFQARGKSFWRWIERPHPWGVVSDV